MIKIGVPKNWRISDIVSLDEELLGLIPTPVYAVLLLFPFSEADNEYCRKQEELAKSSEQKLDPNVYFMKQTIVNGCGVVALIHAIANNIEKLGIEPDTVIKKFIEETKALSPEDKSKNLESKSDICNAVKGCYEGGRSMCCNCDFHFIALIHANSNLYELDGRKMLPVSHGSTTQETFMSDAARVCREYMERDSKNINFTAFAFGSI
ncbi:ubiquitin carboxyl-terminal hydrolase isozyme L3 [Caerostris extrusa]|uniref:Ubiquitin carboxyl-terminal hydrolase n=1 Tax=Caerostris extrusa TaxID=172846 RepID=A0AAV4N656_CAEEX|nr:ubiquitin carboxyl-terminal hydrolase isozyme L3 [Caerostris extrusa]